MEENITVLAFAWSSFCTSVFYGTVFGVDRDISNDSFVFMVHCGNAVIFFFKNLYLIVSLLERITPLKQVKKMASEIFLSRKLCQQESQVGGGGENILGALITHFENH